MQLSTEPKFKTGDLLLMSWKFSKNFNVYNDLIGLIMYGGPGGVHSADNVIYSINNSVYEQETSNDVTIVTCMHYNASDMSHGLVCVIAPNGKPGYIKEEFLMKI